MGKRKRKRTAAEKAARKKRREEFETIFIGGKMKRVRRPPMVEGMTVEDFILANADAIFLHQEEMWEHLEGHLDFLMPDSPPLLTSEGRERVSFVTLEDADDLIVGFAIELEYPDGSDGIASLILQRTPKYEFILPPEERGVLVSHESYPDPDLDRDVAVRVAVRGNRVDIETRARTHRLDISKVRAEEVVGTRTVLDRMASFGGLELELV